VFCNPPYTLAEAFVQYGLDVAEFKVAVLVAAEFRRGPSASPLAVPTIPAGLGACTIEAAIDAARRHRHSCERRHNRLLLACLGP
jgi:hypothetical protein